ncbi:inactive serine/threonine-protein kinase VRK3 isoform X3 [Tyto alba]|uniref:inactive serine/threonine-protein kinase VRK3 isoform X3 n=1 Tax=Tyto alba TaxID=56313 RepID=UPI001C6657BC|nr:inactive serine/threonine-protein kinase VRK3 isoform X3 [Tyto alba]
MCLPEGEPVLPAVRARRGARLPLLPGLRREAAPAAAGGGDGTDGAGPGPAAAAAAAGPEPRGPGEAQLPLAPQGAARPGGAAPGRGGPHRPRQRAVEAAPAAGAGRLRADVRRMSKMARSTTNRISSSELQRQAQKWKKWHSVPFLGIPNCVGFGLHADSYRFLVFSDLGRTLQSVLNDGLQLLREKAAFQIVVRLLDCLEYIHENEYVHGDITAENIYLNPTDLTQVTLAGYCYAFRYCPGGKHVAQREGSRTPHEGTMEFISLDSHKGAGPSRRSDLESLGYCLLKWLCGFLPWSDDLDKVETVVEKKEKYRGDVKCLLRLCFRQRSIPAGQDALQSYLQQVMALQYEEKPDYEALRQLFKKALEKMKASAYDSVDIKMVP